MSAVFIAGATGVIGARLTPLLLAAGYDVHALTRDPEKARNLETRGVHATVGDIFDAGAVRDALARAQPELVIHQLTDLPHARHERGDPAALARNARIRIEGTQHLVDAALAGGAQRMLAQSIAFAYADGREPHVESDPLDPATRGSVIALERLVLESPPLIGTVLRYGSLYGPGTWFDTATGNVPVQIDAAVRATMLAIERGATGVFNIAEERGCVDAGRARNLLGWRP